MKGLQKQFEGFVRAQTLFSKKDKVLLAVSGGLDSSVMTELFFRGGFDFAVAHCNFRLRGKDADKDEQFVKQLAKKYNAPFHSIRFDTKTYAAENKYSVQEAARELRYAWFRKICREEKYSFLVTAHHSGDSMETFFINLLRGTGLSGLASIPASSGGWIKRPLLFSTRHQLEEFAKVNKLKFRHDRSNDSDDYLRNRIRHHLVPLLKELNPDFESVMKRNLQHLTFARSVFEEALEGKRSRLWKGNTISKSRLAKETLPLELFAELIRQFGFNFSQAENIWNARQPGVRAYSKKNVLTADRSAFILTEPTGNDHSEVLINKECKNYSGDGMDLKFKITRKPRTIEHSPDKRKYVLAGESLKFPLVLRRWKAGDFFQPLGMKGRKKISDFLTDKKISRPDKEKTYVLLSGENIVCVLGHRIDEKYKVTEQTKEIYLVEILNHDKRRAAGF